MKKILTLFLVLFGAVALIGCETVTEYKIAMITDAGDIDDKSFNQGTWEGIVEWAEENDVTYKYYKPTEVSDTAYVAAIDLAVGAGAEIIVTPGFLFEPAVYEAQTKHPDVKFVLIDGVPHPGDWTTFEVAANTKSILFREQESGFLAGYAAVMEGYRELGFMGGIAVPAVVRFGLGYVAGAYYAAAELGLEDFEFNMDYFEYLGTFAPSDDVKAKASAWYNAGVEVIHAAAGGAGNSVMAAAEEAGTAMIGVDVDQASQSETVITSAMKALGVVVKQALTEWKEGTFAGGATVTLGAKQGAVGLPLGESFKFDTFTEEQYLEILGKLADETILLPMDEEGLNAYIETLKPEPAPTSIEVALSTEAGAEILLTVVGKVIAITNHKTFVIADGTAAIFVYDASAEFIGDLALGDIVEIKGTRGAYKGMNQLSPQDVVKIADVVMLDLPVIDGNTADLSGDLSHLQGHYFTFTGVTISAVSEDNWGNLTFTFTIGDLTFPVRYDSRLAGSEAAAAHLKAFAEGATVDLYLVLGWYDGPQFLYQAVGNIT
jgi:basic membrane protein A and related proteins